MSRTLFFAVASLALLTLASSFAVASYAIGPASEGPPKLRPNLPAAALPTISLDEATSVKLNNLIGAEGAVRFGITPDSYASARRLAVTSVGTFYLVPGSRGVCIVTFSATACGDPGGPGKPSSLALWQLNESMDAVVGEGIATGSTEQITISLGSAVTTRVSAGQFHIRQPVAFDAASATISLTKK
jgi:hypothetical protein